MAPLFVENSAERLESPQNLLNSYPKVDYKLMFNAGVHKPHPTIPKFLKPIIAQAAQFESQTSVAKGFGISDATVSALANGFNNTKDQQVGNQNPELVDAINSKTKEVHDKAIDCLMQSLNVIGEKLPDAKLSEATQAANVTSAVVERLAPKTNNNLNIGQVIVMAPKQADLNSYGAPIEVESKRIE